MRPFFFITTGYFFTIEIIFSISRKVFDLCDRQKALPLTVRGRLSPPEGLLRPSIFVKGFRIARKYFFGSTLVLIVVSQPCSTSATGIDGIFSIQNTVPSLVI
jgi:hypothetical protein